MNFYEHHLGDYMRDTAHLSMLEDGAYRRLLEQYYIRERPLPADQAQCFKLARAFSKEERDAVAYVLQEFFLIAEDGYHQRRCDEEIGRYADKQAKAKASANARWSHKPSDTERNANAMRTQTERISEGVAPRISERNANAYPNAMRTVCSPVPSPQSPEEKTPDSEPIGSAESGSESPDKTIDQALFSEARLIFGKSIGGQVNKAIKVKGKPWVLGMIEACRGKDEQQARAYFTAALNGAGSKSEYDEAQQRSFIP